MVSEAALLLLERTGPGARPPRGGFCTPATALGAPLREALHKAGIRFDELDELPRGAPMAKLARRSRSALSVSLAGTEPRRPIACSYVHG